MTPPIAIIVRWRCLRPFWSAGAGESVVWVMGSSYPREGAPETGYRAVPSVRMSLTDA